MSRVLPAQGNAVRSVAEAEAYVAGICFKHGPPTRVGLELEWFLNDPADPSRRPEPDLLRAALGPHSPCTLDVTSPAEPLPHGGLVTVEPGGQIEISAPPAESVAALVAAVRADVAALDHLLRPTGFRRTTRVPPADHDCVRLLRTPRYDAMETAFDRIGPHGRRMMCSTAATQICLDLGQADEAADRWRLAHLLGPVLLSAFTTSSCPDGPICGRMDAWWALDPARTLPPATLEPDAYVRRTLDTPVLAVRRDHARWDVDNRRTPRQWLAASDPMTTADLDVHLSTMFPPVRPQGYLELRWLDAQPGDDWIVPLALVAALFDDADTVRAANRLLVDVQDRWLVATRIGLADPILARAAAGLHALAEPALDRLGLDPDLLGHVRHLGERRLVHAITPADDLTHPAAVEALS